MRQKIAIALAVALALCVTCQVVDTHGAAKDTTAYLNRMTWVYEKPLVSVPERKA